MVAIIRIAKRGGNANAGRGVAILTPIQGSRTGYQEATENDGAWGTTGVYMYSELDKSLDNCFYVYGSDELAAAGKLKIGSCKARRGATIPSTFVDINVTAGVVDVRPVPPPLSEGDDAFFSYMHV